CMVLGSPRDCDPGPPPEFSTEPGSAFFGEALQVYEAVNLLTPEQRDVALFWSDDPGLTATPPGHSLSILTQLLRAQDRSLAFAAEAYARLGAAVCDAFIACWYVKYRENLVRPITYIRRHIDPAWGDPLPLATPPFPEYTSGHSVQSGAAAEVITGLFGDVAFTDHTHDARGMAPRSFGSPAEFAQEAAISRLYGGIHFRSAIERGLDHGRCIGAAVNAVRLTR
ncbi:MAG: vanadium-dependent haloperoxidase, partial [Candidatus Limnocylindria bacterium]